jgi:hypothetical protein
MFIYTNPNPTEQMTGDCVIRAIAIITSSTWEKAYIDLCAEGLELADLPNSNKVWGAYLKKLGFKREIISNSCPDCYTIEDFCKEYPYGDYVVCTGSHVVAVMDGLIYDAWDSSHETPLYYYYKEN